jgi:hypothetical protein
MTMPPKPTPNQHSDPASAGVERAPPRSAAIAFSATTAIHGAPNEHAMASKETLATTQEALVSMEDLITSAPEPAPVPRCNAPRDWEGADYKPQDGPIKRRPGPESLRARRETVRVRGQLPEGHQRRVGISDADRDRRHHHRDRYDEGDGCDELRERSRPPLPLPRTGEADTSELGGH